MGGRRTLKCVWEFKRGWMALLTMGNRVPHVRDFSPNPHPKGNSWLVSQLLNTGRALPRLGGGGNSRASVAFSWETRGRDFLPTTSSERLPF